MFFDIHNDSLIKLGDFGLMKRMSEGADQRDLDSSGQELGAASGQELGSSESNTEDIGTTLYIAPEVNRF